MVVPTLVRRLALSLWFLSLALFSGCKARQGQSSVVRDSIVEEDEEALEDALITAVAEALPVTGALNSAAAPASGAYLTDGGAEPLRREADRLRQAFERRKEESQIKLKEAQDRLRRVRTREKACVLGAESAYCVCQASSKDGSKTAIGWAPMPRENQVGLDYLSHEEKVDGLATALNLMVEGKVQSSTCEGTKLALEKRGLTIKSIDGTSASSRNCSCRSASKQELSAAGVSSAAPYSESDTGLVLKVAPVVQVVCEQRFRTNDTIQSTVEHPEGFDRHFFGTALSFVTGPLHSTANPLADLAAVGCQDLNLTAFNQATGLSQPRWMNACDDFAKKSQIASINSNARCEGARPLGDELLARNPTNREGCRCYFGDRNLAARMREFQLKRLQGLTPILEDIAKLDKDNRALEEETRALKAVVSAALAAAIDASEVAKSARLPAVAVLETDPAAEALQALQDRLNTISGAVQNSKLFVGSALKAQISGLTNLNVFSTLTPGKSYENLPRFAATWLYVYFDPALMHEPGTDFRTPVYFNWRHPNCSFAYFGAQDCQFKGPGIPLSSQPTPTQIAAAAGFEGFIRFVPATNLFFVYRHQQEARQVTFYQPHGDWDPLLIGVWRRDTTGLPMKSYLAETPAEEALTGDDLFSAEEKVRPLQDSIVMLGAISTKTARDRLATCRCKEPVSAPTNLPPEVCLQFPPGHGYRNLHRGWICDQDNQRFVCKGKAAVDFSCTPPKDAATASESNPPERDSAATYPARSCSYESGFYCNCSAPCATTGKDTAVWLFGKSTREECETMPAGDRIEGFKNSAWALACPGGNLEKSELKCRAFKWWDDPAAPWGYKTSFLLGNDYFQNCRP